MAFTKRTTRECESCDWVPCLHVSKHRPKAVVKSMVFGFICGKHQAEKHSQNQWQQQYMRRKDGGAIRPHRGHARKQTRMQTSTTKEDKNTQNNTPREGPTGTMRETVTATTSQTDRRTNNKVRYEPAVPFCMAVTSSMFTGEATEVWNQE